MNQTDEVGYEAVSRRRQALLGYESATGMPNVYNLLYHYYQIVKKLVDFRESPTIAPITVRRL